MGVIEELGAGVTGYSIGDRVLVEAITPCGQCRACLSGQHSQSTLCPGGKERIRRLMNVVQSGRFDPAMLVTHRFSLADIKQGYEVFGNRSEGVLKVLITP